MVKSFDSKTGMYWTSPSMTLLTREQAVAYMQSINAHLPKEEEILFKYKNDKGFFQNSIVWTSDTLDGLYGKQGYCFNSKEGHFSLMPVSTPLSVCGILNYNKQTEAGSLHKVEAKQNHLLLGHEVIKNQAAGESFFVCRNCKIEVKD